MDRQGQKEVYKRMLLSRIFEEEAIRLYAEGKVTGSLHPYIGEEAVAAVAMQLLRKGDLFTSTHRGIGHVITSGMDPKRVMAELFGKATGFSGGKGGSMHMFSLEHGNLGTNGIVAGGASLAVGAALSLKVIRKTDHVVFCFFGEGASNEGVTHESMNLASIWKLPVIFVCENNYYQVFTTMDESCSVHDISLRAPGYNMPGESVDGNDVAAVEAAYEQAVARARAGDGPSLIECRTYRWEGHWPLDAFSYGGYRTKEEVDAWKAKCPILRFRRFLLENNIMTQGELDEIHAAARRRVDEAIRFADESPAPVPADAYQHVFNQRV